MEAISPKLESESSMSFLIHDGLKSMESDLTLSPRRQDFNKRHCSYY
jgi:hypothetical protein